MSVKLVGMVCFENAMGLHYVVQYTMAKGSVVGFISSLDPEDAAELDVLTAIRIMEAAKALDLQPCNFIGYLKG